MSSQAAEYIPLVGTRRASSRARVIGRAPAALFVGIVLLVAVIRSTARVRRESTKVTLFVPFNEGHRLDDDGRHGGKAGDDDDDDDDDGGMSFIAPNRSVALRTITMSAFLKFPKVVEFLAARGDKEGVDLTDPLSAIESGSETQMKLLAQYLPTFMTVELNNNLAAGSLGVPALGGHVVFNVFSDGSFPASWLIVMTVQGVLEQVVPLRVSPDMGVDAMFLGGVKNYDEDTLLLLTNKNGTGAGNLWLWQWRKDVWTQKLGGVEVGTHDMQMAASGKEAVWTIGFRGDTSANCANVTLRDFSTGTQMHLISTSEGAPFSSSVKLDENHIQMISNDSEAIISLRKLNAFGKYEVTETGGHQKWMIGGEYGQWPIHDFKRGITYPPGADVWMNPHNVEKVSDDEYFIYDDYGLGNHSRLLIVHVDETAENASLVWEYGLDSRQEEFGDMDPLPTGNILGCYFDQSWGSKPSSQMAGLIEVQRENKDVAWHLRIYGERCSNATSACEAQGPGTYGWKIYSAERFYDSPLFPAASLTDGKHDDQNVPRCAEGKLSFTVFNRCARARGALRVCVTTSDCCTPHACSLSFKENHKTSARYTLIEEKSGHVAATGQFEFLTFWRPTIVSGVDVNLTSTAAPTAASLLVENSRGYRAQYDLLCSS